MTDRTQAPGGPLASLRVLVSGGSRSTLLCGALLADWGADVVLIEPQRGHAERRVLRDAERSALWWSSRARNLRSVAIDPEDVADLAVTSKLAAAADVLVDDSSSACAGQWGPSMERARAANPGLVTMLVSPYGESGPAKDSPGDETTAEAAAGLIHITGDADGAPLHSDYPVAAAATSLMGALSVMALIYRRANATPGQGGHIDLASSEVIVRILDFIVAFYDQLGWIGERTGSTSSYQVPTNRWLTSDGVWMSFTGNTQDVVARFFRGIERPDLIDDPRFATNIARVENREDLEIVIADYFARKTYAEANESMVSNGVPIAPILSMAQIFQDPQYQHRQVLSEVTTAEGSLRFPGPAGRFSRSATRVNGPGPGLDADRESVLIDWADARASSLPGEGFHPGTAPLTGLRVVDNGNVIAGPLAATLLGDLGADVIKVERREGGDLFRRQAPLKEGHSVWWTALARGKRSIALDLKDAADVDVLMELVDRADVVVSNFVPGVGDRLGVGADALQTRNPRLVAVEVSGYGQTGPMSNRRAFGRNAEAFSGMAYLTGYPGDKPQHTGFPVADAFSALFSAFGALAAMYERDQGGSGQGQSLDVALFESVFRFLEPQAVLHDQLGEVWARGDALEEPGLWRRVVPTSDGRWVSLSAPTEHQRAEVADLFDVSIDGLMSRDLDIAGAAQRMSSSRLLSAAADRGIGASLALTVDEVVLSPQNVERGAFTSLEDPVAGRVAVPAVVPMVDGLRIPVTRPAPQLDEHREQILGEWIGVDR